MTSIVFFKTEKLERIVDFYTEMFEATRWLEQSDCTILQLDNQLIGFCQRVKTDTDGTITIVTDTREEVDAMYASLEDRATASPTVNETYQIYHAYFTDPDGRALEVQTFLHETKPIAW